MRVKWNKEYTTISIYAVITFFICLILYRSTISLNETVTFIKSNMAFSTPIILGLSFAYFMNPLVNRFELKIFNNIYFSKNKSKSAKLKRFLSIIISYTITIYFFTLLLSFIIPQLTNSIADFTGSFDAYFQNFLIYTEDLSITFGDTIFKPDNEKIYAYIEEHISKIPTYIADYVPNILSIFNNIFSITINLFVSIVISIYILFSKERFAIGSRKLVISLFNRRHATAILETVYFSNKVFSSFFIGKLIDSLIIGVLTFIILLIFNIPFALMLSVVVAITNMIPYFGPFIGGILGFILLLLVNPFKSIIFFIIILVIQQFDGNILGPMILGDSLNLAPFWIIFSILLFGGLFGPIGMFIGAPLFSVIKTLIEKNVDKKYEIRMLTEYQEKIDLE